MHGAMSVSALHAWPSCLHAWPHAHARVIAAAQGHVGVYWRGGKLLPKTNEPGLRLKLPLLDVYSPIQVTLQTDKVTDIPCGTKGGVMVYFGKVEVRLGAVDVFRPDILRLLSQASLHAPS